jgi:hypothetical protein
VRLAGASAKRIDVRAADAVCADAAVDVKQRTNAVIRMSERSVRAECMMQGILSM